MTFRKMPSPVRLGETNKIGVTGISKSRFPFLNDCTSGNILNSRLLRRGYM